MRKRKGGEGRRKKEEEEEGEEGGREEEKGEEEEGCLGPGVRGNLSAEHLCLVLTCSGDLFHDAPGEGENREWGKEGAVSRLLSGRGAKVVLCKVLKMI